MRGSWHVLLRAPEGGILLRSPPVDTEAACRDATARIRQHAQSSDRFERRSSTHGGHFFVLLDERGGLLAMSPIFESAEGRDAAIETVRRLAADPASIDPVAGNAQSC